MPGYQSPRIEIALIESPLGSDKPAGLAPRGFDSLPRHSNCAKHSSQPLPGLIATLPVGGRASPSPFSITPCPVYLLLVDAGSSPGRVPPFCKAQGAAEPKTDLFGKSSSWYCDGWLNRIPIGQ